MLSGGRSGRQVRNQATPNAHLNSTTDVGAVGDGEDNWRNDASMEYGIRVVTDR